MDMKKLISLVGLGAAVACGPLMLSAAHWYPMRDNVVSLNGTWDFRLYEAEPGSTNEVEINSGKIAVPGNWETQGFIRPRYKRHYQKDYAGVCTRTFAYDPSWKGRRVILRFDAVYFGFTLKVNGRDFGLTTHAPNLHQFDITEALREGTNEIEVKVLTSQVRDWLFDINDCWAIAGITRDVQIFTTGPNWVSDVVFTPTVCADGSADLCVRTEVEKSEGASWAAAPQVRLLDAAGREVWTATGKCVKTHLAKPHLWDVDTPYLYTLEVKYADQVIRERVGIKTVKVDGFKVLVNNRPVFFKGVGLNEIDPQHGRAWTREDFAKRLKLMKEAHVNFIRTVHYPLAPVFYDLCDEMGFYVCNEIPLSAQCGYGRYLDDDRFLTDMIERTEDTIRRDRNRPCVTLWSVGNENDCCPVLRKVLRYAKACDPTRPCFFPMQGKHMMAFADNPIPEVDLYSGHYLKMHELDVLLPKLDKPLLMTEYSHSNGEGFGNFEKTFARMLKEEKMVGGSIWCFHDQCLETDGADAEDQRMSARHVPAPYQGIWLDEKRFYDSHGMLGSDGIVYGTLHPKEAYYLVKKLYGLECVPESKGERTSADPESKGTLALCPDEPALLLGGGRKARFVLKAGRRRDLLVRTQYCAIGYFNPPFYWDPYVLPAHFEGFAPSAKGGTYTLAFYRNDDTATNEVVRGTVTFEKTSGGYAVRYDLVPSAACGGTFLEGGFGFALDGDLARVDWDGFGPFPAVPGKSLMDDPGVWSLRSDDHRFNGNRMHVYWAKLSVGDSALTILTDDGMAGFEALSGCATLTHDVLAVNYGTKLDWTPVLEAPRTSTTPLRGAFTVIPSAASSAADLTPERPFLRSYGR